MTTSTSMRSSLAMAFALPTAVVLLVAGFILTEQSAANERILQQMQSVNVRLAVAVEKQAAVDGRVRDVRSTVPAVQPSSSKVAAASKVEPVRGAVTVAMLASR